MTWTPKNEDRRRYIWNKACELGTWTYKQLSAETSMSPNYIGAMAREWEEKGYVRRIDPKKGRWMTMQVTDKAGTPDICRDDGSVPRPGTPRGNMWRTIRMLGVFTHRDIAMQANTDTVEVTEAEAREYCQMLNTAGYFRVVEKASRNRPALYRLVRNTGPIPPIERRLRAVWDENLGEHVYVNQEGPR